MLDFTGQTVVVTGAGRGQGEAAARLFAALGAEVVVADLDEAPAQEVAASIGDRARAAHLDISKETSWQALLDEVEARAGRIHVLVNNAAVFKPLSFLDAPMSEVEMTVSVNLVGTYLGIRTIGRHMLAHGGGAIVNVASVAALAPSELSTIYGMTKGGVVTLTRGAAVELGPTIRVNCVLPGGIETRLLTEEYYPYFDNIPLGRPGKSEEIASTVAFLASSLASYVTGGTLTVDGGWQLGESTDKFLRLTQAAVNARAGG